MKRHLLFASKEEEDQPDEPDEEEEQQEKTIHGHRPKKRAKTGEQHRVSSTSTSTSTSTAAAASSISSPPPPLLAPRMGPADIRNVKSMLLGGKGIGPITHIFKQYAGSGIDAACALATRQGAKCLRATRYRGETSGRTIDCSEYCSSIQCKDQSWLQLLLDSILDGSFRVGITITDGRFRTHSIRSARDVFMIRFKTSVIMSATEPVDVSIRFVEPGFYNTDPTYWISVAIAISQTGQIRYADIKRSEASGSLICDTLNRVLARFIEDRYGNQQPNKWRLSIQPEHVIQIALEFVRGRKLEMHYRPSAKIESAFEPVDKVFLPATGWTIPEPELIAWFAR